MIKRQREKDGLLQKGERLLLLVLDRERGVFKRSLLEMDY